MFDRSAVTRQAAALAAQGVFIGTSSWKYPGWRGLLYEEDRYIWRGKFAESRFNKQCLSEYAEVFKTVCVDAAYYAFPTVRSLEGLAEQVPADFQFGFKVTDEITLKQFPKLDRFGQRAGQPNPNFLNAGLFADLFLGPCESVRSKVGLLMFEFSRFYPSDYGSGREFLEQLDGFLGRLPQGWPYAVELRNRSWLTPEYFACLAARGVTHVFNSWEAMPPVDEQMALLGSRTQPALVAARFLLKPGRKYEEAVKAFSPYDQLREVNAAGRAAAAKLIKEGRVAEKRKTFIYINNRFEGNSLMTIAGVLGGIA